MVATRDINRFLPTEILDKVFHLLPPRDLKVFLSICWKLSKCIYLNDIPQNEVAVLVCRRWREAALSPCLWSWVSLRIDSTNLGSIPRILQSRWMGMVKKMRVFAMTEELLLELTMCDGFRSITFQRPVCDISTFDPGLLASLIAHSEEVFLYQNPLTAQQSESIFNAIAGDSKLKTLKIESTSLRQLDPDLVARAVTSLEEAHMSHKDLTLEQIEAIFERIMEGGTRLKRLHISGNNLAMVEPTLMASAISMLEKVELGSCLTNQQAGSLFSLLRSNFSKLRMLHIFGTDLCLVDPQVMSRTELEIPLQLFSTLQLTTTPPRPQKTQRCWLKAFQV